MSMGVTGTAADHLRRGDHGVANQRPNQQYRTVMTNNHPRWNNQRPPTAKLQQQQQLPNDESVRTEANSTDRQTDRTFDSAYTVPGPAFPRTIDFEFNASSSLDNPASATADHGNDSCSLTPFSSSLPATASTTTATLTSADHHLTGSTVNHLRASSAITENPTLVPISRDFQETGGNSANQHHHNASLRVSTHTIETIPNPFRDTSLHSSSNNHNNSVTISHPSSSSGEDFLSTSTSGRTMGYNNTTISSAWNSHDSSDKMEASTLRTEQTREDEDDNTTIQSNDSLQGQTHIDATTPSTISTAPLSDDASLLHRRTPSWDLLPHAVDDSYAAHASQLSPSQAWGNRNPQRVASFRPDGIPPRWPQQPVHYPPRDNRDGRPGPPLHSNKTPPRNRGPRLHPISSPLHELRNRGDGPAGSRYVPSTRSSSEILKTLLRKKACLYEPDTSRAVTLITWLVGRQLALEFGFFSRQQLQAGVHACVAPKIDSGVITRTKVNRCMQIILNSCFHYIIPRPDGTEESGETFRHQFRQQVSNDDHLLKELPSPWNDMSVERQALLQAVQSPPTSPSHTPQVSPIMTSKKEQPQADDKRAVLLCFNENVRSAIDVFRCHNEFIHDTAHASNLQLTSQEWRNFFGAEAASAPRIWGNVGIPLCHPEGQEHRVDALGVMSNQDAAAFRTTWCSKRYDHHHELCGFAHPEVNGGWLRRNPAVFNYSDEMCPHVHRLQKDSKILVVHECPHGIHCSKAHSMEEILYHPNRYKTKVCPHSRHCQLGYVCPHFHPIESYRVRKPDSRSRRPPAAANRPSGAPILYTAPAPMSAFEQELKTPGLQNLYRRHCAVTRALLRQENPVYHLFDNVIESKVTAPAPKRSHWA